MAIGPFIKINRQLVYGKFNGKCAYCGKDIGYHEMQVDHLIPKAHKLQSCDNITDHNDFANLMPSCSSCNHYKRSYLLEDFRDLMKTLINRCKCIYIVRIAFHYGILKDSEWDGLFYFEKFKKQRR